MVKEEESEGENTIGLDTNAKAVVMIGRKHKVQDKGGVRGLQGRFRNTLKKIFFLLSLERIL